MAILFSFGGFAAPETEHLRQVLRESPYYRRVDGGASPCRVEKRGHGRQTRRVAVKVLRRGVLFGCFGRKIDGDSWFTWWFNHLPGPSISPKRTPKVL